MWTFNVEKRTPVNGLRVTASLDGRTATVGDAIEAMRFQSDFRTSFNTCLAQCPFRSFRWETPATTSNSLSNPFEFVLLDSPELIRKPDPKAFEEYLSKSNDPVVAFPNLGGDAILVLPRPLAKSSDYGHLAAFVRTAPEEQIQKLWQTVGNAFTQRIGSKPVWLNTAGAGVPWLHVRLDDRPKYYAYRDYQTIF